MTGADYAPRTGSETRCYSIRAYFRGFEARGDRDEGGYNRIYLTLADVEIVVSHGVQTLPDHYLVPAGKPGQFWPDLGAVYSIGPAAR